MVLHENKNSNGLSHDVHLKSSDTLGPDFQKAVKCDTMVMVTTCLKSSLKRMQGLNLSGKNQFHLFFYFMQVPRRVQICLTQYWDLVIEKHFTKWSS